MRVCSVVGTMRRSPRRATTWSDASNSSAMTAAASAGIDDGEPPAGSRSTSTVRRSRYSRGAVPITPIAIASAGATARPEASVAPRVTAASSVGPPSTSPSARAAAEAVVSQRSTAASNPLVGPTSTSERAAVSTAGRGDVVTSTTSPRAVRSWTKAVTNGSVGEPTTTHGPIGVAAGATGVLSTQAGTQNESAMSGMRVGACAAGAATGAAAACGCRVTAPVDSAPVPGSIQWRSLRNG